MFVYSYDLFTQEFLCASYARSSYQPSPRPFRTFVLDGIPLRFDNYQSFRTSFRTMRGHGDAIVVLDVSYILRSCEFNVD